MSGNRRTPPLPAEEEIGGGGVRQELMGGGAFIGRRDGDPSSSRPRSADLVWPEHFVEAVAARVATDAALDGGRLDAAPAVVTLFQVCSAWRSISRSELLWEELTRRIWTPHCSRRFPSWRDEFTSLHRTAANFRTGRCLHTHVHPSLSRILTCRRLTLTDRYMAAGFSDGSVRLYNLPAAALLSQHDLPLHRDRLGHFSPTISGIIILSRQLIFASQDGDIYVASFNDDNGNFLQIASRRARAGNPVEDGTLVDFTGDGRRWVGLFAGVPGWSWRVWDGETEEEVYAGGSLTDADSVAGWHMLADISGPSVARIGVAEAGVVVGCTSSLVQAMRVGGIVEVTAEMELRRGAAADALGASDGRVVVVDGWLEATVREAGTLAEVCSFLVSGRRRGGDDGGAARGRGVVGCMNWGFVVMWMGGGAGRVWDAATGQVLYRLQQRIGETKAAAANDRYIAAWAVDTGLHLWDFDAGL